MVKKAVAVNISILIFEAVAVAIRETGGFFEYYTVDSNLIAASSSAAFIICAAKGVFPSWLRMFRYISASMLLVTFFVVMLILAPMAGPRFLWLFHGSMFFQHLICPVISLLSFIILERPCYKESADTAIGVRENILAVIPTLVYGTILLVLNGIGKVKGPYPFLMVNDQSPFVTAIWVAGIAGIAYVTALFTRKWYNSRL